MQLGSPQLEEVDAASRVGHGEHDQRPAVSGRRTRGRERLDIVAVHADGPGPEGLEALLERIEQHRVPDLTIALLLVDVDVDADVVEPVEGHRRDGLPDLALLELPVAHDDPDAATLPQQLAGEGEAAGLADALGQRAGGGVDAGRVLVPDHLDGAAVDVELVERLGGQPADLDERRVQHQRVVGRREDELVLVRTDATVVRAATRIVGVVRAGHTLVLGWRASARCSGRGP